MSQQPSTQAGPVPDPSVHTTFTTRGVQHVQAMSLDVQIREQQDKAFLVSLLTQSILNHIQPLEIAIKRSELVTINGILNLNNISEGFLLAGQHRCCAFQMFVQEKENSIQDIKLDQDAWARHKLFGNDDTPPPQMKGPVPLTSADDPAGNEYIKNIQDIVDNARYWLVKVYDLAFLRAVEAQPLALHLTNNDPTIQYFSEVHEQDQQAAQILSNAYLQWPDRVVAAIRFNDRLISSKISDNQDAWELWAALLLMPAWYGKHCVSIGQYSQIVNYQVQALFIAWLDARLKDLNYYLENTPTRLIEHNCSSIDAIANMYGLYTHSLADAPSRTAFRECMKSYWQDMCLQQDLGLKLCKECPTWFILTRNALGAIMNHLKLVEYGMIELASWICPWLWTKPNSKGQPYHLKCASGILLDALTKVGSKKEAVNYLFDIHGPQLIPFFELVNKYLRERNISIRNLSTYAAQQRRVRMKESCGPEKYGIFWDWLKTVFQHFSQSSGDEEFIPLEYFEEMFPPSLQDDYTHTLRQLICSKTFSLIKLIVLNKKSPAYIRDMIFKTYAVAWAHGKDLIHLLQESDDTHQF
ncbi:hypothetical protein M422DRAFT_264708 [Sphaerobolus stellatus SS14]|uniref:Uncharacterized protein n=1 Tax=Sphaerobolus stellatus (strain SS14) TaxID=990650 RepID=A0A0C9V7J3_SPHS4|nr:hypothetical protein M422DRAFT_264708 [Sphaerobolus stellatus SS14]